ncbi:hypothetical protein GGR88_002005 [Sphingomonas jejuensis]|uniref:Uncharacterized protein n=1 Tax=Sphingomonas jejuensis TaxID=904715 RepID=A0ABX0XP75_9SPHN|nr:hypothetical protein [Sphingomonas jejuensis]NJC34491.1 hypothetical protein [Sphingomonas jejuensis]
MRNDPGPSERRQARLRLKQLMTIVAIAAIAATALAIAGLWLFTGPMPIHMLVATVIGVSGSVLLGGGLMALVFMSSGTGHDERVHDFEKDKE